MSLRDAKHLWDKMISETYELLKQEHGVGIRTIGIGPAGENLVKSACTVTNDLRTPGWSRVAVSWEQSS